MPQTSIFTSSGNTPFIGVYDSGLGGLSVLSAIRQILPRENLLYFADSANAPYGDRPVDWITQRVMDVVDCMRAQGAKAVVLACNTATAIAVESLREVFSIPIVAIEPGIKVAVENTRSGVVGVIGTTGTLQSDRYRLLLARFQGEVEVLSCATPGLVNYIEANELEADGLHNLLQQYIQPMLQRGIDHLVLGCTHYPFIENQIRKITGNQVTLVDPAGAVANYLQQQLLNHGLFNSDDLGEAHNKDSVTEMNSLSDIRVVTSGDARLARKFLLESVGWDIAPTCCRLPQVSFS